MSDDAKTREQARAALEDAARDLRRADDAVAMMIGNEMIYPIGVAYMDGGSGSDFWDACDAQRRAERVVLAAARELASFDR